MLLNPIKEGEKLVAQVTGLIGGLGVDVVFECLGVPAAFRQPFQLVRPGGHEFELALDILAQGKINTELILSDAIPLVDIEERGFQRLLSTPDLIKILVKP